MKNCFSKCVKYDLCGAGPWVQETDFEVFDHKGITCCIRRNPVMFNLNGYCKLPDRHKYIDISYFDIPYEVHGGLTFGEWMDEKKKDEFWIGFDCCHSMDYSPKDYYHKKMMSEELRNMMLPKFEMPDEFKPVYRDIEYVRNQCRELAEQILGDM